MLKTAGFFFFWPGEGEFCVKMGEEEMISKELGSWVSAHYSRGPAKKNGSLLFFLAKTENEKK